MTLNNMPRQALLPGKLFAKAVFRDTNSPLKQIIRSSIDAHKRRRREKEVLYQTTYLEWSFSQNHRMVGVRRELCGSCSPTPLLKQGHLQQAAQEFVQAGLEYLQRRRIHNLPGQLVPLLCHTPSEVVPHVQVELPMLQFVPIAPSPVAGHH